MARWRSVFDCSLRPAKPLNHGLQAALSRVAIVSLTSDAEKERGDSRLVGTTRKSAGVIRADGRTVHDCRHAYDASGCNHGTMNDACFHVLAYPSPRQARRETATARDTLDALSPLPSPPQSNSFRRSQPRHGRSRVMTWIDLNPLGTD
jgi:hypothetical protein